MDSSTSTSPAGESSRPWVEDLDELGLVVRDAAARTAHREARTQDARVARGLDDVERVFNGIGVPGTGDLQADLGHGLVEELAVLAALDGIQVATDHLDAVFLQHAGAGELNRGVQAGLAAERGQQRVGALALNHALDELGGDGLNVGAVGQARVRHDGRRIGVDEHDLVAVLLENLAGLRARVIELARLTDDNRAGADDENPLDICTLGHVMYSFLSLRLSQAPNLVLQSSGAAR